MLDDDFMQPVDHSLDVWLTLTNDCDSWAIRYSSATSVSGRRNTTKRELCIRQHCALDKDKAFRQVSMQCIVQGMGAIVGKSPAQCIDQSVEASITTDAQ